VNLKDVVAAGLPLAANFTYLTYRANGGRRNRKIGKDDPIPAVNQTVPLVTPATIEKNETSLL
jgi:hypothetical protein